MNQTIITGKTALYGIVGNPVTHSLSPVMQNAAFSVSGYDAVYVPFQVLPESLSDAVKGLKTLGVKGFNVTVPHKSSIMQLLDEIAPSALKAGAVNTVVNRDGKFTGHNTDGDGLLTSLAYDLCCKVDGANILLIGAGGAARGAISALCQAGVKSVTIVNRTRASAESLADLSAAEFPEISFKVADFSETVCQSLPETDLVINASSAGMQGDKIDGLPLELLPCHAKVYDMVYNPYITPLISDAKRLGLQTVNGTGMLVAQGELSYSLWFGKKPAAGIMINAIEAFIRSR